MYNVKHSGNQEDSTREVRNVRQALSSYIQLGISNVEIVFKNNSDEGFAMKVQQNFIHYILPIFFMCGAAFLYAESVQAASDNVLVTEFPLPCKATMMEKIAL